MDRRAELEQKRAKVEAMRLERQRREAERLKRGEGVQSVAKLFNNSNGQELDADAILRQLGIQVRETPQTSNLNGSNSVYNADHNTVEFAQEASELNTDAHLPNSYFQPADRQIAADSLYTLKQRSLAVSKVCSTSFAPPEKVLYCKETQTNMEQIPQTQRRTNVLHDDASSVGASPRAGSYLGSPRFGANGLLANLDWDDEFIGGVLAYDGRPSEEEDEILEVCFNSRNLASSAGRCHFRAESVTPSRYFAIDRLDSISSVQSAALPVTNGGNVNHLDLFPYGLSEDERMRIVSSDAFLNFMTRATRIVERTLEQDDTLVDYSTDKSSMGITVDDRADQVLQLEREFFDERWCRNRLVTAIDWHSQFPELLLTAYSASQDIAVQDYYSTFSAGSMTTSSESGVCLIWNARYKSNAPEFTFTCESALTTACFVRQQPNLLVGGTYSGQLVIWDTRVPRRSPVHRTLLSASAHTHPVYCIQPIGGVTQGSQLLSVSSDGRLCVWSAEMLSRPLERLELTFDKSAKSHIATGNVAVTALSCPVYDANAFLVGSEDGGVYLGSRHGQTQNRSGLVGCFEAHGAHISSVHCSPHALGSCDLSHLFLTAAFDSTIRLWSLRDDRPICTLERAADYLNDAQFSPVHPSMFATVDSLGRVEIWNLLRDTESPIAVYTAVTSPAEEYKPGCSNGVRAQCKVRWNAAGNRLAVGDCGGRVQLLSLADRVALPQADDTNRFARLLAEMKSAQTSISQSSASQPSLPHRVTSPQHRSVSPLTMTING